MSPVRGFLGLLLGLLVACSASSPATDGGGVPDLSVDAQRPGCTGDDDCQGATPHCDTATSQCIGCRTTADCRGALKCDPSTGICRDCIADTDCAPDICSSVTQQCSRDCNLDADCAGLGPNHCHPTLHICVDCYLGQHCGSGFCETVTYSCVGCLKDGDCPMTRPFCGPSLECTPSCTSSMDCPRGLVCDPASSRCVECVTNGDCSPDSCQTNYTCG